LNLVNDARVKKLGEDDGPAFRLPSQALWGIGLIAFCCMLGEGAMADWSTIYLEKVVKSPEALAPIGLAAFSLAMMLGRFGGDWARAYFGDQKLMFLGSLIAIGGLAIALAWLNTFPAILGLFLTGVGLATIVPIAYSTAGKSTELSPGVGIAMVTTIGYAGFLFGPPIIGFVADGYGLRTALGFVLLLFLVMVGLSFRRVLKTPVS
jgi:fucose permease